MPPLRAAAVQMETTPGDSAANFARAEKYVEQAAKNGAKLILLPEFFHCGYTFELEKGRPLSEPLDGPAATFLRKLAKKHDAWVGGCLYEGSARGCFDTFLFAGPDGSEFTHRKRTPFGWERYFFEPGSDPIVHETPLGKVALVVCAESFDVRLLREAAAAKPDLVLIGYSAPVGTAWLQNSPGGLPRDAISRTSARWARVCGAPAVVSSVTGNWASAIPGLPFRVSTEFVGQSGLLDPTGAPVSLLDREEGVAEGALAVGHVEPAELPPAGRWVTPMPWFAAPFIGLARWRGSKSYAKWRKGR
jgi:predicted amidohydrolase